MDHHNGGGATASYSGLLDRYYRGRRATSMYIPRFRNVGKREEKFTRGYGYEVYTYRGSWTRGVDSADFGADFKNEITRPGEWSLYMEGYGETLAEPRQPHVAVAGQARCLGHSATQHLDEVSRQRTARWRSR